MVVLVKAFVKRQYQNCWYYMIYDLKMIKEGKLKAEVYSGNSVRRLEIAVCKELF